MTAAPDAANARARSALVDATMELAGTHDWGRVSPLEIAAAAKMEPADFFVHFADKDDVVLSVLGDLLAEIARRLGAAAFDDLPHALMAATTEMLQDIVDGRSVVSTARLTGMAAAITASPSLQKRVSALRRQVMGRAAAGRLGVEPDDPRVRRAIVAWSAVVAASYHADLGRSRSSVTERSNGDLAFPARMSNRLDVTYRRILGRAPDVTSLV